MDLTLVVFFLYHFVAVIPTAVLQLVLPELWAESCNENHLGAVDNGTRLALNASGDCSANAIHVGIVLGSFSASAFIASVPIGWLVHRTNQHWTFCFGLLLHAIGCAFIASNNGVVWLSFAALVYGFGAVFGTLSESTIVARTFTEDASRSRVVCVFYLITTAGYGSCFLLGTRAYKVVGQAAFFAALAGVFVASIVVHIALNKMWRELAADYETISLNPTPDYDSSSADDGDGSAQVDTTTYTRLLREPIALFTFGQILCVYWGLATVSATGPAWLQRKLAIGAVENGGILGVSSLVDCFVLVALVALIDSNRKRWICFMAFILLQAAGCSTYPFVDGAILAVVAETAIRSSKAVTMALAPLVLFRIVDVCEVGTYSRVTALYTIGKHSGYLLGMYGSPWLIKFWGFDNVYFGLAAILVPLGVATVWHSKLS